jgi:anti-sigma28 factor (negative regulator of flagellin synthesis)
MVVYMKVTGSRLPARKAPQHKAVAMAGGEDIGRQARVTELRGMVKAKNYRVDSYKLATRILARALSRGE